MGVLYCLGKSYAKTRLVTTELKATRAKSLLWRAVSGDFAMADFITRLECLLD